VVKVQGPYPVDPAYGGLEYETLASLVSNCGIDNLKAIAKGNELCGAYSLGTISAGGVALRQCHLLVQSCNYIPHIKVPLYF